MNTLQEGDLLFALSQHAVEFAHAQLQQQACLANRSALFRHWPHNGAGPAYRKRADVRYPLDREISEVLLQLPELQTLPESARSFYAAMVGANCWAKRCVNAVPTSRS
jgi:uroporphyrinogen-III synthase